MILNVKPTHTNSGQVSNEIAPQHKMDLHNENDGNNL